MDTVRPMVDSLLDYTTSDLESMERERPELGRVELIDGALHATGESALGITHQIIMQRLFMLLQPLCPPGLLVMLDTWWHYDRSVGPGGKIRADVAVYRASDIPDGPQSFRAAPLASLEILSDDIRHDTVSKDSVYAEHGTRRAYLDPRRRNGWWLRLDGVDHDGPTAAWELDGWAPIVFERDALLAPAGGK